MCTVSYLPISEHQFILTSNRDEAPNRAAAEIVAEDRYGKALLYPRDPQANGSWIVLSDTRQLVCILNGAFEKHKHRPPYRLSRGIMALEFFSFDNASHFFENYIFEGIEPFTMLIYDQGTLYDARWDEQMLLVEEKNPAHPHLWSSCTLYDNMWQQKRRRWFYDWQDHNKVYTQEAILDFHHNAGEGNPAYDVIMNRNDEVRTTSISSAQLEADRFTFRFEDLQSAEVRHESLAIQTVGTGRTQTR